MAFLPTQSSEASYFIGILIIVDRINYLKLVFQTGLLGKLDVFKQMTKMYEL